MPIAIRQSASATRETIYWPADTPKGGIVCLHGSEGGWAGWNDLYCALFAANGFVALSRNYSQTARWLTHPDIDDVPLEGTQAALAAMRAEVAPFGCAGSKSFTHICCQCFSEAGVKSSCTSVTSTKSPAALS